MLSLKEALNAHAAASTRTFAEDRSQTVGASEVGQCERKVWFSKFEGDVDARGATVARDEDHEDGWGARARGSVYEDAWWAPALKARFNGSLLYAGDQQRTLVLDYLSATPDGIVVDQPADALAHLGVPDIESDCVGIECKTIDPRARLDGPKPEHVFQVIVQLGMFRAVTNHKPTYGLISYTDASFWDQVEEFPVQFDRAVFQTALDRARMIMTADAAEQLKPEGWIAGGKECGFCPFAGACGHADQRRLSKLQDIAEIDVVTAQQIETKALVAREAKQRAARASAEARAKEEEIKALLTQAGTRSFRGKQASVTWSSVKGRPSWDNKGIREAAEAAGVDLSAFSTVGDPTDRLTITSKA